MVSKKVAPRQYYSNGAACGLKVEIRSTGLVNPAEFVRQIRGHMESCELAVAQELKKLAVATPIDQTQLRESTMRRRQANGADARPSTTPGRSPTTKPTACETRRTPPATKPDTRTDDPAPPRAMDGRGEGISVRTQPGHGRPTRRPSTG